MITEITKANHRKGKYNSDPMRINSKSAQTAQSAGIAQKNVRDTDAISFGF